MILASYNLDSLDDDEKDGRDFGRRVPILRRRLDRLGADVLCLQEVNGQKDKGSSRRSLRALDRLLEGTRYAGFRRIHTSSAKGGPMDVHNLVILSRYPFLRSGQTLHDLVAPLAPAMLVSGEPLDPMEWDRPFLYAALEVGAGRPFWVVNLHLRAPIAAHLPDAKDGSSWRSVPLWAQGFARAALKRIGQALEVRLFLERLFDEDSDALICVCGDFNAEGAEMPVRLIRADPDDTENPELAKRRLLAVEMAGPSTRHGGRPMRPDHLLASPDLAARHRRSALFNQGLPDDTEEDAADSSHAAILAEFALAAGGRDEADR